MKRNRHHVGVGALLQNFGMIRVSERQQQMSIRVEPSGHTLELLPYPVVDSSPNAVYQRRD